MNILAALEHSCAVKDIPPLAEAPEATNVEEMLPDSGFVGSGEAFFSFLFLRINKRF